MDNLKLLREETGLSFAQIKKALDEVNGDIDQARSKLKEYSAAQAEKKADREVSCGVVASYVHSTALMGSIISLGCETDFVANNPEFKTVASDIAMHVCAVAPENLEECLTQAYVKNNDITVQDYINQAVQKFGENVKLNSITRYSI